MDVRAKLEDRLRELSGSIEGKINGESTFVDLGLDSIAVGELFLTLEEDFAITPDEEAFQKVKTVDDLVTYVETRIKK